MEETINADVVNVVHARKKKVKINRNKYGSAVIKIDAGSADILEQFANEAGLPISQVASNFIKYAVSIQLLNSIKEKANGNKKQPNLY